MLAIATENLNAYSQQIHEQAIATAKKYLVAEAEVLSAIMRIDQDETYKKLKYDHLTPYCVHELKLSEEVAGTFVRVARKSREIPNLILAVEEGLALTKAKAIVSVLTIENQSEWIAKAQNLSKANLEKEISIVSPSPYRAEKAKPVGENRHRIEFELNDASMELQSRARDLVSQKMGRPASLADTQKYLLENFLNHEDPIAKAQRSSARAKKKEIRFRQPHRSWGRSIKAIPATVKHQVFNRDRGCCQAQNPDGSICLKQRWVELHHIQPRSQGGADSLQNLITLCSSHHRLVHN